LSQASLAHRGDRGPEAAGARRGAERRALTPRTETTLWIAQRASAAVLALCVTVHLVTIVYAVRGGLTAAEILARTRGNNAWLAFYALFVVAVSIHAPIGLRAVLGEWVRWRGASREFVLLLFSMILLWTGMRAVFGVFQ
jgi:fumarate reductase subunit C